MHKFLNKTSGQTFEVKRVEQTIIWNGGSTTGQNWNIFNFSLKTLLEIISNSLNVTNWEVMGDKNGWRWAKDRE